MQSCLYRTLNKEHIYLYNALYSIIKYDTIRDIKILS